MNPLPFTRSVVQCVAWVNAALESAALKPAGLGLIVGPVGAGKSEVLRRLAHQPGRVLINVGDALTAPLLPLPAPQRHVAAIAALEGAVAAAPAVALLDDIELLFLPALELRPFELLCQIAQAKTVLAAWPAPSRDALRLLAAERVLAYATEGHPEHVCVPLGDTPAWVLG